jgi:hypothetical protein
MVLILDICIGSFKILKKVKKSIIINLIVKSILYSNALNAAKKVNEKNGHRFWETFKLDFKSNNCKNFGKIIPNTKSQVQY